MLRQRGARAVAASAGAAASAFAFPSSLSVSSLSRELSLSAACDIALLLDDQQVRIIFFLAPYTEFLYKKKAWRTGCAVNARACSVRQAFQIFRGIGKQLLQPALQEIRADERRHEKVRHQLGLVLHAGMTIVAADPPAFARIAEVAVFRQRERGDVAIGSHVHRFELANRLAEPQHAGAETHVDLLHAFGTGARYVGRAHDVR